MATVTTPTAELQGDGPAAEGPRREPPTDRPRRPSAADLLRRGAGWPATIAVAGVAAALRLPALGRPGTLVFDETYYVKDAWTLLNAGFESDWPEEPNPAFEAGDVDSYLDQASYVVHPQVGKWVIALGLRAFGAQSAVGWRIGVAVAGIVTVILVTRLARRLLGSTALGVLAGTLVAIDGSAIVHSRVGLLDGILAMWLVAGFTALVVDRDRAHARLALLLAQPHPDDPLPDDAPTTPDPPPAEGTGGSDAVGDEPPRAVEGAPRVRPGPLDGLGPRLGWRPYRILGGVLLGLAVGTKWSALWFVAVFGLLSVAWDASTRRRAGVRRWWQGALLLDAAPAFCSIVLVGALTYVASWWSWFASDRAYGRNWAQSQPDSWVPDPIRSFWNYHEQMWSFHTGLQAEHPYISNPLGWLLQLRPTSFFYESPTPPEQYCGTDHCSQAITSLGNPLTWWLGTLALVAAIWWVVRRRDGLAGTLVAAVLAGWVPWLAYPDRPIFTFYAISFFPFLAVTLAWAVGRLWRWGTRDDEFRRRWVIAALVVGGVLVVGASAFFYPLWTAQVTTYDFWQLHMWLPSWV